jgi:thiamine biosynthesis lipoprotein
VIGRFFTESFHAMGTACLVGATAPPRDVIRATCALAAARAEVAACERALSRFDPLSDLSRLNASAGDWVGVDSRLLEALALALRAREETGGRFDPTVLPALVAAGYDRSFEQLTPRKPHEAPGWRAGATVELRPGAARVEPGAAVDLGGIGKGFAATRAIAAMHAAWPALPGALVDLGGDIAVDGAPPERGPWRVAVADPRGPGVLGTLELLSGGVATSGRDRRRFGPGKSLHHLIDAATGRPAAAGPLAVTVVAADAAEAEMHATALAVTDSAAEYVAERPHLAALVVPSAGPPQAFGRLPFRPREAAA